jgi:hypothetical protein
LSVEDKAYQRAPLCVTAKLAPVTPAFLIVPPSLEVLGEQLLTSLLYATQTGEANPFTNSGIALRVDPRIKDGNGAAYASGKGRWYLVAAPGQLAFLEFATLSGAGGAPAISTRPGFDILGLEYCVVFDFAFAVVDHRATYMQTGAV